jgi:hypothetical protein
MVKYKITLPREEFDEFMTIISKGSHNIYRTFSFFDKENLVVPGNVLQKKTQKTSKQELEKHPFVRS